MYSPEVSSRFPALLGGKGRSRRFAHIEPGNRWIMVRDLVIVVDPSIDMNMLQLDPLLGYALAHKHVVELFHVASERVRIPLRRLDIGRHVAIHHARDCQKRDDRLHDGELVTVARQNNRGLGVLRQDLRDEALINAHA